MSELTLVDSSIFKDKFLNELQALILSLALQVGHKVVGTVCKV